MTDDEAPNRGRSRTSARQTAAPAGEGWDPIERCDWEAVASALMKPWPLGAQRHDLRYWASRQRAHKGDRPGYRLLAERWGITEKAARIVCSDVEWWADPRFGDPDPKRAQQGRTEGAARAHEGRTEGAARAPKDNSNSNTNSHTDIEQILSATPTQERPKPEKVKRAAEAAQLLALLDALRLMRHRGRKLSEGTWVPKLEKALAKRSAQSIVDGYVWMLRSPQAAFLRGEDGRGTTDYTVDLSTCLAHPEYADRRRWKGSEGPLQPELDRWEAALAAGEPEPAWVERWAAVDGFAADRARARMQPMEDGDYDEIF